MNMNRKVLADMAINDAEGFATLAELAKSKLALIKTKDKAVARCGGLFLSSFT